jgi:hypothetical protein
MVPLLPPSSPALLTTNNNSHAEAAPEYRPDEGRDVLVAAHESSKQRPVVYPTKETAVPEQVLSSVSPIIEINHNHLTPVDNRDEGHPGLASTITSFKQWRNAQINEEFAARTGLKFRFPTSEESSDEVAPKNESDQGHQGLTSMVDAVERRQEDQPKQRSRTQGMTLPDLHFMMNDDQAAEKIGQSSSVNFLVANPLSWTRAARSTTRPAAHEVPGSDDTSETEVSGQSDAVEAAEHATPLEIALPAEVPEDATVV